MSEWIYFIRAPQDDFAGTMTDEEKAAGGFARGELRPLRISLLRGRDG